jgi:hypothetical protein
MRTPDQSTHARKAVRWLAAVAVVAAVGCSGGKGSGTRNELDGGVGSSSTSTVQAPGTTGGTTAGATQGNQQQQPNGPTNTTRVTSQSNGGR